MFSTVATDLTRKMSNNNEDNEQQVNVGRDRSILLRARGYGNHNSHHAKRPLCGAAFSQLLWTRESHRRDLAVASRPRNHALFRRHTRGDCELQPGNARCILPRSDASRTYLEPVFSEAFLQSAVTERTHRSETLLRARIMNVPRE